MLLLIERLLKHTPEMIQLLGVWKCSKWRRPRMIGNICRKILKKKQ